MPNSTKLSKKMSNFETIYYNGLNVRFAKRKKDMPILLTYKQI